MLAELAREVADEAREAQEDGLDGDHADLHHEGLEGVRAAREVLDVCERPGRSAWAASDLDPGALDDQLAHEVHQRVEALGVDAHGGGAAQASARRGRVGHRRGGTPRPAAAIGACPAASATSAAATSGTEAAAAPSASPGVAR